MSDTPRCEPPPELLDRDGWHWVERAGRVFPAKWHKAPPGHEPLWGALDYATPARPKWAHSVWEWRYLSPVLTPAEVAALRAERDAAVSSREVLATATLAAYAEWSAQITNLRAEAERLRELVRSSYSEGWHDGQDADAGQASADLWDMSAARAALEDKP